jgi:hypothetical protein
MHNAGSKLFVIFVLDVSRVSSEEDIEIICPSRYSEVYVFVTYTLEESNREMGIIRGQGQIRSLVSICVS